MGILISENTKIIVQGITGREAANFTRDLLEYGMPVVAGVTPGKGGMTIHRVPVFDTVRETAQFKPEASVISVPAPQVWQAAREAIEQRIPLLVVVSEHVPRRDIFRILEAADRTGVSVLGPNSLGVIVPGRAKIGMIGGPLEDTRRTFTPGPVGVVSRSGGMTAEIANALTLVNIGQSTCVSIGGDPVVGTSFGTILRMFENDSETRIVVLFTEPGSGAMEEEVAALICQGILTKPIVALVAGGFADEMPGVRFGHAGSIVEKEKDTTRNKCTILRNAGVRIVNDVEEIVTHVRRLLEEAGADAPIPRNSG